MSKVFRGSVSIVKNTKGEIALKKDADGVFNAENVTELHAKFMSYVKDLKAPANKWSYWIPENTDMKSAVPVLMADRFGNPRLTMMSPVTIITAAKAKVTKLA